jgi:hypothetical protein
MLYFRIRNGTIQANNGRLAIQAPLPVDLDCCPHAGQFIKAIAACEDVISLHLDAGKLVVRSGKFKTHVDTFDRDAFPEFIPAGARFPLPLPILPVLRKLLPFVSTDERRPWACGVQIANNSAVATNSICMVEHWLPFAFPVIANIPRDAIAELVRLKIEPISLQADTRAVVFHLPGDAWVACSLMVYEWPDVQRYFAEAGAFKGQYVDSKGLEVLLDDVAKLEGFTGDLGAVYFHKGSVSTMPEGQPGTVIDSPASPGSGVYRADQLAALRGIVDRIGFGAYPAPIPFFGGDMLRGVMVGFQS